MFERKRDPPTVPSVNVERAWIEDVSRHSGASACTRSLDYRRYLDIFRAVLANICHEFVVQVAQAGFQVLLGEHDKEWRNDVVCARTNDHISAAELIILCQMACLQKIFNPRYAGAFKCPADLMPMVLVYHVGVHLVPGNVHADI